MNRTTKYITIWQFGADFRVFSSFIVGEGNGNLLQYSCLENPMDRGAWWLQSMGSLRVRHDWATSLSLFTFMHWRRKWQPTPLFLPGESQGRGSLVGCHLWGRTESDTTEATKQQQHWGQIINKKIQKDQNLTKTSCWEQKQGTAHALCYSTTRSGQITYLSNPITGPTYTP